MLNMSNYRNKIRNKYHTNTVKEKTRPNISQENVLSTLFVAGDYSMRCRLCGETGASCQLKSMTTNDCNQSIARIFRVHVPCEGMICESCLKCLKVTERFRALVLASFEAQSTDASCKTKTVSKYQTQDDRSNNSKEIIELLTTRLSENCKRKVREKRNFKRTPAPIVETKRTYIACTLCNQKYPMMLPVDGLKNFVCSRCRRNNQSSKHNRSMPKLIALQKEVLKHKRYRKLSPENTKETPKIRKCSTYAHLPKYRCPLCTKKYGLIENLATHIKNYHESVPCQVCGEKCKNRQAYDTHIMTHVKIYQCDHCMRVFKNKNAMQIHISTCHGRTNRSSLQSQSSPSPRSTF